MINVSYSGAYLPKENKLCSVVFQEDADGFPAQSNGTGQ